VTVEAGIVELIKDISKRFGTSMIYISHNLGLILETCHRITVMYSGQAVELGSVEQVFNVMRHPYTRGLFSSIPLPGTDRHARPLLPIRGQLPPPHQRPKGCYFHPRCDFSVAGRCDVKPIRMEPVNDESGHIVRCIRWDEINWEAEKPARWPPRARQSREPVLQVRNMRKYYEIRDNSIKALISGKRVRYVKANEKLDFEAREAETVAIVGESGCGKSTFAKVLMGLEEATGGEVLLHGKEVGHLEVRKRKPELIRSLQIIFQNPFETLNPSHSVGSQIARVLKKFGIAKNKDELQRKVFELARPGEAAARFRLPKTPPAVGRPEAARRHRARLRRRGLRCGGRRAGLGARCVGPGGRDRAVDRDPARERRTTLIFISHDLSVVRYLADRVVVMYLGHIMEQGAAEDVFSPPYHPYTEALLSAVPIADTSVKKKHIVLKGELPSPINPPSGCPFQTRCHRKIGEICETELPPVKELSSGHKIMCHLSDEELLAPWSRSSPSAKRRARGQDRLPAE
jgi:peptide/nickel transport system ATP-binding protein